MATKETPVKAAERIVASWLDADYSNAATLYAMLNGRKRELFEAALTTIALAGVKAGMSGEVEHS